MRLRTTEKGRAAIFEPWQVPLVDELFNRPMTSGDLHLFAVKHNIKTHPNMQRPVSRASVIFFLNKLVDDKLLTYTEVTGKGGWYRKYKMTFTREEFALTIIDLFLTKLQEVFPEASTTFSWTKPW